MNDIDFLTVVILETGPPIVDLNSHFKSEHIHPATRLKEHFTFGRVLCICLIVHSKATWPTVVLTAYDKQSWGVVRLWILGCKSKSRLQVERAADGVARVDEFYITFLPRILIRAITFKYCLISIVFIFCQPFVFHLGSPEENKCTTHIIFNPSFVSFTDLPSSLDLIFILSFIFRICCNYKQSSRIGTKAL